MSEVDSASDCSLPAGDGAQSTIELAGTVDGDANNSSNNIETALVKRSSIEIPVTIEATAMSSPILQLDRFTEIGIHVDESSSHLDVSCSDTGDLFFLVQGREFVASKTVLSSKSPIFAALLEQKPSTRYIVSSIDGDVFAAMLDYIRTSRIGDELTEHAADLLEVAHKTSVTLFPIWWIIIGLSVVVVVSILTASTIVLIVYKCCPLKEPAKNRSRLHSITVKSTDSSNQLRKKSTRNSTSVPDTSAILSSSRNESSSFKGTNATARRGRDIESNVVTSVFGANDIAAKDTKRKQLYGRQRLLDVAVSNEIAKNAKRQGTRPKARGTLQRKNAGSDLHSYNSSSSSSNTSGTEVDRHSFHGISIKSELPMSIPSAIDIKNLYFMQVSNTAKTTKYPLPSMISSTSSSVIDGVVASKAKVEMAIPKSVAISKSPGKSTILSNAPVSWTTSRVLAPPLPTEHPPSLGDKDKQVTDSQVPSTRK